MMKYTIAQVATLMGADVCGSENLFQHSQEGGLERSVGFLLTDSRSLSVPEETLFFALKTARDDGQRYIPDLYRRGVRSFVVTDVPAEWLQQMPEACFLKVANTLRALQLLARRHREQFHIPVVGITGSNGKTMVKEWLCQLLAPQMRVTRSPRSYNSQVGVPLSVWLIDQNTDVAIIEAGISQPGEMDALREIIQPTIAVLTNIGAPHQENFASLEAKAEEKLRLFEGAQVGILARGCEGARCEVQGTSNHNYPFSFLNSPSSPLYINKVEKRQTETAIRYQWKGQESSFTIPFIDEASVHCALCAAAVALTLGISSEALAARMPLLEPVAMRLEVKQGQHGCTLINDSYNSDVNSLDIALDFMNRRPDHEGHRRTLILSDIPTGDESPLQLYQHVDAQLKARNIDKLIGIGPELMAHKDVFHTPERHFFQSVDEFVESPVFGQIRSEVVLLKGARRFGFDRLTDLMVERQHQTTLDVNLKALVDNLNLYRSYLRKGTLLTCMIKADGYGTGAIEIAKTLQEHHVDYLAVAVADEGVALRKNGITANIMVMNPEMNTFKTLFDYRLEPEVYSFRLLRALIREAEKEGVSGFPVHIKLDTGMHRLGFNPTDDMEELIQVLKSQSALMPRSVFSHFVGSDSDSFDDFSAQQFALYDRASQQLQAAFDHRILRHICNSAGIEHFPERQLDMCRLGIGLYGVNPLVTRTSHLAPRILHTVATLHTTILQIRSVKAGDSIGYSRRTVLERDSRIAAIPIGYADGLRRALGNRHCHCLVAGQPADYVGNICMDVAMIDVTDIPCQEGDRVEIFGPNLPITTLAEACDTISYEILTGISPRVRRVYYQE